MAMSLTQADLDRLFPNPGQPETEQARGLFKAALRLGDGLAALAPTVLLARLADWMDRRSAAAELYALSDRDLADIGLTRGEIEQRMAEPAPRAALPAPSRRPTVVLTPPRRAAALAG